MAVVDPLLARVLLSLLPGHRRGTGRVARLKTPERFVTEAGPYQELSEMFGLDAAGAEAEALAAGHHRSSVFQS